MSRNLDRRVEVVAPIKDQGLKQYLREVLLGAYLRDNVKARGLQSDGAYARLVPQPGEARFDSQSESVWAVESPLTSKRG